MSDLPWGSGGFVPDDHDLYLIRARSGDLHIRIDPPLHNPVRSYSWGDERVQAIASYHGYTTREELPGPRRDYSEDATCERCGETGADGHHTAPQKVFREEADEYPIIDLCRSCHAYWHEKMEKYYELKHMGVAEQALSFLQLHDRVGGDPEELFDRWARSKSFGEGDRERVRRLALENAQDDRRHRPKTEVHVCERCGSRYTGNDCPRCDREDRKGGHIL